MCHNTKNGKWRFLAMICVLSVCITGITTYWYSKPVYAEINQTVKLNHTMATQTEYEAVKEQYIPRVNDREDAESVKVVSYDASAHAMKFTMTGWYNSSGCKLDVTDAVNELLSEAKGTEGVTVGVSAELKGEGRDGGFGFLKDSSTTLDPVELGTDFAEIRKEMPLSEFESKYTGAETIYVGAWSGGPSIFLRNLMVYYYTGEREKPVEMEEDTSIPEGATGFYLHEPGTKNTAQTKLYQPYDSGTLKNQAKGMLLEASTEGDTNGVATNITQYVKKGISGNVFGASLMVNVENWSATENKQNKASLFFEVRGKDGAVKKKYMLETDGPNDTLTNLTNATSSVGEGWLTSLLSGESPVEFDEADEIFLCTNQKNKKQTYTKICLWGYIDTYQNPTEASVTAPELNDAGDAILFTVSNLTEKDKNYVFTVNDYKDGVPTSQNEYTMIVPSGTEKTPVSLKANGESEITIRDAEGKTYVDACRIGTCEWVGTWSSAQLTASGDTLPPDMGLSGNTYRQMIRTSVGGSKLRLTFSNEFGKSDLEIKSVHLADQLTADQPDIDTTTDTVVTFHGEESVTVPAGETVTSDDIDYSVKALERVAVSMYLGKVPEKITSHTAARCHNWLSPGNRVKDASLGAAVTATSWYFLDSMDVIAPEENDAIVCFGDSITDGYGCANNKYQRWSDVLAEKLQEQESTRHLSVLNKGIGGNAIFGGNGPAGKDRFDKDVLQKAGVKYLVLLEGVNDIGSANDLSLADRMIEEYKTMIAKAHAAGIKVYAGTILPFKGNSYYSELHEEIRQKVNTWILSGEAEFDGTIDFAKEMADSSDPQKLASKYNNDSLHPSAAGYRFMGELVFNTVFKEGVGMR